VREVVILGVGMTRFGASELSMKELFSLAAGQALAESGVEPGDVEGLFVGQCLGVFEEGQANIAPFLGAELGLPHDAPASRFESACASATVAIRHGALMVGAGVHDLVLCGGVERATVMGTSLATTTFAMASHAEYECPAGITFPGVFGLAAHLYAAKYGLGLAELKRCMAEVAVKNHRHGFNNPLAQFRKEITVQDVLESPMIADPLQLYDCCPFSDGAAAVVLADAARFRNQVAQPILVAGLGQGQAGSIYAQKDITLSPARQASIRRAYRQAGIGPAEVDVCELHDCFTIAEIIATEALGFFDFGTGAAAARRGETTRGGRVVINPSGGLKAKGHPIGATGAAQTYEIVKQLRGECGPRQVEGARIGLVDTLGGDLGAVCNLVLRRA